MPEPQILVIGTGVIGLSCARALARGGAHVCLLDPGPLPGAASVASAGMLAAQIEADPYDPALALTIRAREIAVQLAQDLEQSTGITLKLQLGIARIALTEAEVPGLRQAVAHQCQLGLRTDWLDVDQVRARWPGITLSARGALMAPEDGALDPMALLRALWTDAARSGATRLEEHVTGLDIDHGRIRGVVTDTGRHEGTHVVVAAGTWSPSLSALPRPLPVTPMRGQIAALPWPSGEPPAVVYGAGGYVVHRGDHALAGTTMEPAEPNPMVTDAGLAHVVGVARTLYPALQQAPTLQSWAGLRPFTPDARPIVGREPDVDGLFYATGHGRNGILLAGLTGEVTADLIKTDNTDVDIGPWKPDRFASQP